jgi:hypothetical protein
LHGDRARCEQLGAAGRERVCAQFTWEHFRQRVLEAYAEVSAIESGSVRAAKPNPA